MVEINWLAVVVAAAVHQVLGGLWYGPLFGKMWMASIGKTKDEVGQAGPPLPKLLAISALCSLVTAIALAVVIALCGDEGIAIGMGIGALTAIGFIATSVINNAIFEDRSKTTVVIYLAYQLLGLVLMGAVLGAWQ